MSERQTEAIPARKIISRRRAIYTIAGLGAGGLAAGVVTNEVKKQQEGIETEHGIFTPLYEDHRVGINASHIPDDIDIFFRELITYGVEKPKELLMAEANVPFSEGAIRITPDEILEKLASQRTKIMYGDVPPPLEYSSVVATVGEFMAGANLAVLANGKVNNKESVIKRRKLLRITANTGIAWLVSPFLFSIPTTLALQQDNMAIRRISSRMKAMSNNLHPEDTSTFFRSLLMAHKLLLAAKVYSRDGKKTRIAFIVGGAHANIEDFLQAGPDFCRNLLLAHPKFLLKDAIKASSVKNISSVRLLSLPEDFKVGDPKEYIKSPDFDSVDETITDVNLYKKLWQVYHPTGSQSEYPE